MSKDIQKNSVKLIIPDVEFRKPFDVVNIMKEHYGYECILCSSKNKNRILSVIYGQKIDRLRHSSIENFAADLKKLIEVYKNSELIYIPVSDKSIDFFYQFTESNSCPNLSYRLPSRRFFDLANDKIAFQGFCEEKGFPVPRSYKKTDIVKIKENFHPLILKPKDGQGSVGIQYFHKLEELEKFGNIDFNNYILQDKIESNENVAGAFFLCEGGVVLNAYTHRRIRTFPTNGGVTVYSISNYIEEIIEIGGKLLKELNWDGLAMVEFMYDKNRERWVIIELNPRIWGSVLLSAFNKSDLLKGYVQCCLHKPLLEYNKPESVYIRWLFPFEVLNLIKGDVSLSDFFKLERDKTCFINFTYASWFRSVGYFIYFTFNIKTVKRSIQKIFK